MMRSQLLAWVCMGASFISAPAAMAAKEALNSSDILWSEKDARNPAAHAYVEQVRDRFDSEGPDAALALLKVADDSALQQFATHALLIHLGQLPPRRDADALIAWAKAQPVRLWIQHDETAAAWYLPLVDVSRTASNLEQLWRMHAEREAWAARIQSAPELALRDIAASDEQAQQRAGEALSIFPEASLAEVTRLALAQPEGLHGSWWQGLASARPSLPVIEQLWLSGHAQYRLDAIRLAAQRLDWAEGKTLLSRFEQDPELASASTLALIGLTLSSRGPAAEKQDALIIERIEHPPTRASAVAALARLAPVDRDAVISRLWDARTDAVTRSGLRQALRIAGDAEADRLLKRLVDGEEAP